MGQFGAHVEVSLMKYMTAFFLLVSTTVGANANVALLPHRAVYDLKAEQLDKRSGIVTASGLLAYEITGSLCSGWSTSYRIATRYTRTEAGEQLNDTQVTGWEAGDGSEFQMDEKQFTNTSLVSQKNISAKTVAGKDGEGHLTRPTEKDFTIPKGALFPLQHQVRLLELAMQGKTTDSSSVFEGSEDDKTVNAVTVIGTARDPSKMGFSVSEKASAVLKSAQAWPMSVSYYPLDPKATDSPDYQTSFLMFANGVSDDLFFDYGTYALKGKLKSLEFLPVEKCP
jgi:hypothetical protein